MTIAFFGRVRSCHIERKECSVTEQWLADRGSNWHRWFDRLHDLLLEANRAESGNVGCASQLSV